MVQVLLYKNDDYIVDSSNTKLLTSVILHNMNIVIINNLVIRS